MEQQLNRLHTSFLSFQKDVFDRFDRLEHLMLEASATSTVRADPQASSVMAASRVPMSDLNGRSYDLLTTKALSVDGKLQYILSNPKMTSTNSDWFGIE